MMKINAVLEPAISNVVGQSICVISVPAVHTDRMDVRNVLAHRIPVAIQNFSLRLKRDISFSIESPFSFYRSIKRKCPQGTSCDTKGTPKGDRNHPAPFGNSMFDSNFTSLFLCLVIVRAETLK